MFSDNQLPSGTPGGTGMPSWASTICTFAPFIIKALLNKSNRAFLLGKLDLFNQKYIQGTSPNDRQLNKIRKSVIQKNNLKQMKQAVFDQLPISNGRRVCPAGYDYSGINPGKRACLFTNKKSDIDQGNITRSFLGHNKRWPNGSLFNDGCILGRNSHTGDNSVLNGCDVMSGSVIGIGAITKNTNHGNDVTMSSNSKAIGVCHFGSHCKFGTNVVLMPDEHGVCGHNIGEHLCAGDQLTIKGQNNVIGHSADIGIQAKISNTTIHHSSRIRELSVLTSPYFAEPADVPGARVTNTLISASAIHGHQSCQGIVSHQVDFVGCEISQNITTTVPCKFVQCELDVGVISENSVIEKSKLKSSKRTILKPGISVSNSQLENFRAEGSKSSPIKLIDSLIDDAELKNTLITGNNSTLLTASIHEGCELRGEIGIGAYVDVKADLKIRNNNFEDQLTLNASEKVKITFYSCKFSSLNSGSEKSFHLHRSAADSHKLVLNSCQFDDVDNVHATRELVKVNRTNLPNVMAPNESKLAVDQSIPSADEHLVNESYMMENGSDNIQPFAEYERLISQTTSPDKLGYDSPEALPNLDIIKGLDHEPEEKPSHNIKPSGLSNF